MTDERLAHHPERQRAPWDKLRPYAWETGIARQFVGTGEVLDLLDHPGYFELLGKPIPESMQPGNIVAFTFTDKAAAELKERIVTRTREALGEIHGMADMFVGTIHAFCLDLLRDEAPEYLKYEVLNEVQQALFVDRHSRRGGLTTSTDLQERPLKRFIDTNHYVNALAILREAEAEESPMDGCSSASNPRAAARLSRSPFVLPAQPIRWAVRTSNASGKNPPSCLGTDSSSSSFTGTPGKCRLGPFEHFDCLAPRHRREVVQEIVEPVSGLQILDQDTNGNPGPGKHRRPAEDINPPVDYLVRHRLLLRSAPSARERASLAVVATGLFSHRIDAPG